MFENTKDYISNSALIEERASIGMMRLVFLFAGFLLGGFILWAIFTELDEVAVANGKLIPKARVQGIQHLTGGRVEKLMVAEGDVIKAGQVLMKFNTDEIELNLRRLKVQLETEMRRYQSLKAETRKKTQLANQGLFPHMDLVSLQRNVKQSWGQIVELRVRIEGLNKELSRADLVAPNNGRIFNVKVIATGAIVKAGETVMELVPETSNLLADVQIKPEDIGHVRINQPVTLKFNTYEYNRYGGLQGKLLKISPTTVLNEEDQPVYQGFVEVRRNSLDGSRDRTPLVPGMTLTADIRIGSKSVMEYLLKPIFASARQAFRER